MLYEMRALTTNIDKKAIYELYSIHGIVDELFPLTRSCENEAKGQQMLDGGPEEHCGCLLYTSPSPRDVEESRMPSSA